MPTLDLHGLDAYYSDEGEGIPVVLTHADCSSGAQWRKLSHRLGPGFRLLALDQYGHGKSPPWPEDRPYNFDEVDLLLALMEMAKEPVHLVGHSAGGLMAVWAAMRMPEKVATMTLVEPALWYLLGLGGAQDAYGEIRDIAAKHIALLERGEFNAGAKCFVDYWSGEGSWDMVPEDRRRPILAANPKVGMEWTRCLAETTPLESYGTLDMPVLLIRGGNTKKPGSEIVSLLAGVLPTCRVVDIPEAGHMSPISHPEPVNAAIAEHLNGHRS